MARASPRLPRSTSKVTKLTPCALTCTGRGAREDSQSDEADTAGNTGYAFPPCCRTTFYPTYRPVQLLTRQPAETEATPEQVYQLVHGMIEEDLLYQLAVNLWRLPFEARKDTQVIFSSAFRFRPATASPKSDPVALSWVVNNRPQVLIELCKCYDHKESATPAGSVLREVLKSEAAAAIILYDDGEEQGSSAKGIMGIDQDRAQSGNGVFWRFFDWIDKSSFEVAADAFTTFRASLIWAWYSTSICSRVLTTWIGDINQAQGYYTQVSRHQLRHVLRQI
jgi:hypothetical protein